MESQKKTFYVSVQSGSILPNIGDDVFEFEIEATADEINKLQLLFDEKMDADDASFVRSHVPFVEYSHDKPNDQYDDYLHEVYRMLHALGTPATKKHIESMNIL